MKKVAFRNLGCKVNEYELEYMQQKMSENGYEIVPFDTKADIYVVNTCTVTNIADRKSRQMLHKAKKENPGAIVVAVGCYVQTDTKGAGDDDAVDIAIGNNHKAEIATIIAEYITKNAGECRRGSNDTDASGECRRDNNDISVSTKCSQDIATSAECSRNKNIKVSDLTAPVPYESMLITRTSEHTRAFMKIQDGCNQFCSYCAIPLARGRIRSRKLNDILEEASALANNGYHEVVLTGIHLSSYGLDFHGENYNIVAKEQGYTNEDLLNVIEEVAKIPGISRIRLGSLEPRLITEEFLSRLSKVEAICPHFHLSLQSGCDETLKRMNRKYTTAEFKHAVELLRTYFDNPAVTTDVIVGFPGETNEEFEITYNFLKEIKFFEMHVFKYSRRRNTVADKLPNQVSDRDKDIRSDRLLELDEELSTQFRNSYIGKEVEVLFEELKDGRWVGHTKEYILCSVGDSGEALGGVIKKITYKM